MTTTARAKELRRVAEHMITYAKAGTFRDKNGVVIVLLESNIYYREHSTLYLLIELSLTHIHTHTHICLLPQNYFCMHYMYCAYYAGDLHNRRLAAKVVREPAAVIKLFGILGPRYFNISLTLPPYLSLTTTTTTTATCFHAGK
jgi:ribosomal protein L17